MAVSKEFKYYMVYVNTAELAELMANEFGGTTSQWLITIQQSRVYANLLDLRTRMWGEGLMYLRDSLVEELRKRGQSNV